MRGFERFHPIVNFIYYFALIGVSMVFMHPFCVIASLFFGLLYLIVQKGRRAVMLSLSCMLPLFILTALLNPLFNHAGVTILAYLPGGNPLTFESLVYGALSAFVLVSVICHFACLGEIITGDKLVCLFGKAAPSIALAVSMAFRFVPLFLREIKEISDAQKGIGRKADGSVLQRIKSGVGIVSIMITKSLENAVESANSMKSRGYGSGKRRSFSNYSFSSRDATFLALTLLLFAIIVIRARMGAASAEFFPQLKFSSITRENVEFFIAYFTLAALPLAVEIKEVWRWKKSKSKT